MFIRSERLFLRPGWPEDWAELHTLIDDEHVVRHLEKAPWPYRPEDARDFAAREQDEAHPHFFITLPGADGAQLIGCAGLIANENACAEGEATQDEPGGTDSAPLLGYWIAREHWGRGYATEAARALLCVAASLGHRRIAARHFVDNPGSGRVLAKLGFRPTGEIRPGTSHARTGVSPTRGYALDLVPPGQSGGARKAPSFLAA